MQSKSTTLSRPYCQGALRNYRSGSHTVTDEAAIRKSFAERIADLNEQLAGKNTQARHRFIMAGDELKREQAEAKAAMKQRWREYSAGRRVALSKRRGRVIQQGQSRGLEPG